MLAFIQPSRALLVVVLVSSFSLIGCSSNESNGGNGEFNCDDAYQDIRNDIDEANFCEEDEDCTVLILGGTYIDFGCYHFINKAVDTDPIFEKLMEYADYCVDIINDCAPSPDYRCDSDAGKCVAAED